jgi:glycosyltransferase involved in cell wall biosynthesis
MDISIILCTYNRSQSLITVLENIQRLNGFPQITWETLVVDNNSTDETNAVVTRFVNNGRGNVRYIFEGRQGKSYALNTGIEAARGDILAFTDDDVIIDPNWLLNIKKTFGQYDCAGIGGKIIPVLPEKKPSWLRTDTLHPFMSALGSFDRGEECCELKEPPYGANIAFNKKVFIKHGLFRIDLGPTEGNTMGKGEDVEFSQRLLAQGEKLMYVPDAVVYHRVQKERLEKKSFQSYYFNHGRYRTRTERDEVPKNAIYYFGVPRYMFKRLFRKGLDWLFCFDPKRRTCYKLGYYELLGRIAEYINTRKVPQPTSYK